MSPCHVITDGLSHENPRNKNFMSLGIDCMIYVYVDAMQDMGWGSAPNRF
jgi:hypothetical protein